MNIAKRPTVEYYQKVFQEAETALEDWYDQFRRTNFKTPQELKSVYRSASIVGNSRVVFNIFQFFMSITFQLICYQS